MTVYESEGFCPICEAPAQFRAEDPWLRDHLLCGSCSSLVRERALALVLSEQCPNWRHSVIHESSPADRGISRKLRSQCRRYIGTHYYPDREQGSLVGHWRNENLERQTFADETFDLVISLDVMEHVFHPERAYQEIYRTLRPGGHYLHTFPINKGQVVAAIQQARLGEEGQVVHLVPKPEYHGNPISDQGALVTMHYGYDVARQISDWSGFDVRILRFWDTWHALIGDYTEVVVCTKR